MRDDKIKEIRARHEDVAWRYYELPLIYEDRAFLLAEVERLRAALEVERLRLAACDVVAMADTPESADRARQMQFDFRSAALSSVERRVDEIIALRAENERLTRQRDEAQAEVARMKKLHRPLADLPWPTREENGR
jgi:hypothetical protein